MPGDLNIGDDRMGDSTVAYGSPDNTTIEDATPEDTLLRYSPGDRRLVQGCLKTG